jgi:hypothetical protein
MCYLGICVSLCLELSLLCLRLCLLCDLLLPLQLQRLQQKSKACSHRASMVCMRIVTAVCG